MKQNNQKVLSKDEMLLLDNQLCFSLYVASKELIRKYKPLLNKLDLTYTGYIAMLALWEQDNINVKDLGARLFLDSGTLTPLLKKLEKKGYIKRKRSEKDERIVYIILTKAGRDLKKEALDVPEKLICNTNSDLSDLVYLRDKIKDFLDNMQV